MPGERGRGFVGQVNCVDIGYPHQRPNCIKEILRVTGMSRQRIYRDYLVSMLREVRHVSSCSRNRGVECKFDHVAGIDRPVARLCIGDPKTTDDVDAIFFNEGTLRLNFLRWDLTIHAVALLVNKDKINMLYWAIVSTATILPFAADTNTDG